MSYTSRTTSDIHCDAGAGTPAACRAELIDVEVTQPAGPEAAGWVVLREAGPFLSDLHLCPSHR